MKYFKSKGAHTMCWTLPVKLHAGRKWVAGDTTWHYASQTILAKCGVGSGTCYNPKMTHSKRRVKLKYLWMIKQEAIADSDVLAIGLIPTPCCYFIKTPSLLFSAWVKAFILILFITCKISTDVSRRKAALWHWQQEWIWHQLHHKAQWTVFYSKLRMFSEDAACKRRLWMHWTLKFIQSILQHEELWVNPSVIRHETVILWEITEVWTNLICYWCLLYRISGWSHQPLFWISNYSLIRRLIFVMQV